MISFEPLEEGAGRRIQRLDQGVEVRAGVEGDRRNLAVGQRVERADVGLGAGQRPLDVEIHRQLQAVGDAQGQAQVLDGGRLGREVDLVDVRLAEVVDLARVPRGPGVEDDRDIELAGTLAVGVVGRQGRDAVQFGRELGKPLEIGLDLNLSQRLGRRAVLGGVDEDAGRVDAEEQIQGEGEAGVDGLGRCHRDELEAGQTQLEIDLLRKLRRRRRRRLDGEPRRRGRTAGLARNLGIEGPEGSDQIGHHIVGAGGCLLESRLDLAGKAGEDLAHRIARLPQLSTHQG